MTSFDFEDNPFWRIREEIDQLQGQYSKLEYVPKGACKLLGDCKHENLLRTLRWRLQRRIRSFCGNMKILFLIR